MKRVDDPRLITGSLKESARRFSITWSTARRRANFSPGASWSTRSLGLTTSPPITSAHTVTPSPLNPLGVKGAGETGTVAAPPAMVNAVVDVLAPFGIRHLDMPLTPEKVWRAIHGK